MTNDYDAYDIAVDEARREWPGLDFSQGSLSSRLIRIGRLLERKYEDVLVPFGLRLNDLDILGALRRAGNAIPPSSVGRSLTLSSTTMTTRADRLEAMGYVERRALADSASRAEAANGGDRRMVLLSLTEKGSAALDRVMPVYLEAVREAVCMFSAEEREALEDDLRRMLRALEDSVRTSQAMIAAIPE